MGTFATMSKGNAMQFTVCNFQPSGTLMSPAINVILCTRLAKKHWEERKVAGADESFQSST